MARPEQTDVHKVVREHYLSFKEQVEEGGAALPYFVEKAFEKYLGCGHLANGFVRVRCKDCAAEQLVAFSCKTRGLCTSCDAKRMAEAAAHLVDEVLPVAAYRQWVFTLPHWLRYPVARDHELLGKILNVFVATVSAWYRKRARADWVDDPRCAAISVTQRFGDALRLNPHYHVVFADGVFARHAANEPPEFYRGLPVTQAGVEEVLLQARRKVLRLLLKRGIVVGQESDDEGEQDHGSALALCSKASMLDRVTVGTRRGQLVARVYAEPPEPKPQGRRCAALEGFTVHANTQVAPMDRVGLERLCRYLCRPSFSVHRMQRIADGRILFKFKRKWGDGAIAKIYEPMDLIAKLVALVVKPRVNLLRYHGQLAANASWRREICPGPVVTRAGGACEAADHSGSGMLSDRTTPGQTTLERRTWAEMLKRCFKIDVLQCDCGGRREVIAAITAGPTAIRILKHLGEPNDPPFFKRARPPPDDWSW